MEGPGNVSTCMYDNFNALGFGSHFSPPSHTHGDRHHAVEIMASTRGYLCCLTNRGEGQALQCLFPPSRSALVVGIVLLGEVPAGLNSGCLGLISLSYEYPCGFSIHLVYPPESVGCYIIMASFSFSVSWFGAGAVVDYLTWPRPQDIKGLPYRSSAPGKMFLSQHLTVSSSPHSGYRKRGSACLETPDGHGTRCIQVLVWGTLYIQKDIVFLVFSYKPTARRHIWLWHTSCYSCLVQASEHLFTINFSIINN